MNKAAQPTILLAPYARISSEQVILRLGVPTKALSRGLLKTERM